MAQSLPTAKMPQTPQQKEQRTTTESSSLLRKTRFYLKEMKKFKPIDHRLKQKFKKKKNSLMETHLPLTCELEQVDCHILKIATNFFSIRSKNWLEEFTKSLLVLVN
jgi:hypothetical protein